MSANPDLTIKQKKVARELRAKRPLCIPGTNAIISASEAKTWHDQVATAGVVHEVTTEQLPAFCDMCGVAD